MMEGPLYTGLLISLFKITLKTIIMRTSFQFHESVPLNILPTLGLEILLPNWAQRPGPTF